MRPPLITHQELRRLADRAARRCRHVVQAVLREEEWHDADAAFSREIFETFHEARTAEAENSPARREGPTT
jgi:hypothetical protein